MEIVVVARRTGPDSRGEARRLLLSAAAEAAGTEETGIRVEREPGGRPRLAGAALGWHVSVSHGRGLAAVALTRLGPVGLDVEVVRPVPAVPLARRWFGPAETAWVAARPEAEQRDAFFWLWTRKEAVGKALGTGLRGGGTARGVGLPEDWRAAPGDRLRPEPGAEPYSFAMPGLPYRSPRVVMALAGAHPALSGAAVALRIREGPEEPAGRECR